MQIFCKNNCIFHLIFANLPSVKMQKFCAPPNGGLLTYLAIKEKYMNSIKFVHVPMDKYYEFIKGAA
jgi:hypothetical protein